MRTHITFQYRDKTLVRQITLPIQDVGLQRVIEPDIEETYCVYDKGVKTVHYIRYDIDMATYDRLLKETMGREDAIEFMVDPPKRIRRR